MQIVMPNRPALRREKGFSLIELSIVLTVIGLLVGGFVGVKALIRASEMRSVITSFSDLQIAVKQFQMQYKGIPGDITDATRYWGALDPVPANCILLPSTTSTGTKTCNGDGDGKIYVGQNESFRFWQQLSNAGLLAGKYTGVSGPNTTQHAVVDVNVPSLKGVPNVGWSFDESAGHATNAFYWARPDEGNSLALGVSTGYSTENGAFSISEAWGIDKKIDDGKPGIGSIQVRPNMTTGDRTQASTAEYDLSSTNKKAAIWFVKVF